MRKIYRGLWHIKHMEQWDEVSGSGSLRVEKDGSATGEMHLHMGDNSDFAAIRAPK